MRPAKRNPRLQLRLFGLIAIVGALAVGLGIPALLLSAEGTYVGDPEGLGRIVSSILGGGIGLGLVLIAASFFVRPGKS